MFQFTEATPNDPDLQALRKGYPDLPEAEQCHGQEFRDHAEKVIAKITQRVIAQLPAASAEQPLHVVIPLRAALPFASAFYDIERHTVFHFVDVWRDEQTAETMGTVALKEIPAYTKHMVIADPMLATGNTMLAVAAAARQAGFTGEFVFCSVVAAPEGIDYIQESEPNSQVVVGEKDNNLDKRKFIEPGLGDFGDKWFYGIQGDSEAVQKYIADNLFPVSEADLQTIQERLEKEAA